jgi:glycine/D-amino acid oxidase-like deaminating enzyme
VSERQVDDLVAIREQHERVGYESELVIGADRCREYLSWTWADWEVLVQAILHERRGGWADAMQTVRHLADRARAAGAEIREGVEVVGFALGEDGVQSVATSEGRMACETVVVAPGPWIAAVWSMLGQAPDVEVGGERRPLVSYWKAQEGEFALSGTAPAPGGPSAPVVHLDQSEPLRSDRDGRVLVPGAWGIYFRMGRDAITGGGLPVLLADPELDPYGSENPDHVAGPDFAEFFTSGLATALRRFRGRAGDWRSTPGGGIVPHTPDNYPVCDWVLPNVYAIIDSGHGFKTLALGRLVADDILEGGEPQLEAFRLGRFARGATLAASKGPYPWT